MLLIEMLRVTTNEEDKEAEWDEEEVDEEKGDSFEEVENEYGKEKMQ